MEVSASVWRELSFISLDLGTIENQHLKVYIDQCTYRFSLFENSRLLARWISGPVQVLPVWIQLEWWVCTISLSP